MQATLQALRAKESPFDEPVPREYAQTARWVVPMLVGEVEHRQWTPDNRLRHPSWRGLRPDLEPADVVGDFHGLAGQ